MIAFAIITDSRTVRAQARPNSDWKFVGTPAT